MVPGAIVNGINSLISLSLFSLLVCKKAAYLYIDLVSCHITELLYSSSSLGVESFPYKVSRHL